jgi:uncharacterized protein (DUF2141 family)
MNGRIAAALVGLTMISAPAAAVAQAVFPLTVVVTNVKKTAGTIRVAVCTKQTFMKDCAPYEATARATVPSTTLTVPGLPAGSYAAQVFHDENDNHKVDRGLLGIPREGIGFSNDAPIRTGPPGFQEAEFKVDGAREIEIKLRHMIKLP